MYIYMLKCFSGQVFALLEKPLKDLVVIGFQTHFSFDFGLYLPTQKLSAQSRVVLTLSGFGPEQGTKRLAKPCNCSFCVAAPTSANKHTSVETHFKLFSLVFWGRIAQGTRAHKHMLFLMPEHVITAQDTCLLRHSRPPLGIFPHSGILTLPAALST